MMLRVSGLRKALAVPVAFSVALSLASPAFATEPDAPVGVATTEDGSYLASALTYEGDRPVIHSVEANTATAALRKANAIPGAVSAQLDTQVEIDVVTNDTLRPEQYDLDALQFDKLTAPINPSDIVVAVVDTGVDAAHPDFGSDTVMSGIDLVRDGQSPRGVIDPNGHGTHVAGTIAATANNGEGITGMASGVRIYPVRVLDTYGRGSSSGVAEGIVAAADSGADVINLSLGGWQSNVMDAAVSYAIKRGSVVVASSGNTGDWFNERSWPGASPGAITVGATDDQKNIAPFSTHNDSVEIVAPGVSILSTYPSGTYQRLTGTSMAAPHVAAAAALLLAKEPTLTPSQVRDRLEATADDLGAPGKDEFYGSGFLDILELLGTTPGAPAPAATNIGQNSFDLDWPSFSDGGVELTGYDITVASGISSPVTLSVAANASRPIAITGLVSDSSYGITMTAKNTLGTSAQSFITVKTAAPPVDAPAENEELEIDTPAPAPVAEEEDIPVAPVAPVETAPIPTTGYRTLADNGTVTAFGDSTWYGNAAGLSGTAVTIAATNSNRGYWVASSSGEVYTFGDAPYLGGMGGKSLNAPIINMAVTPTGEGYWLLAQDGGVFSFGDAQFYGSTGDITLNKPAVAMAPTTTGGGYWFVASDGGIFAFGDAAFYGSMGDKSLNQPVVGMTVSTTGGGYRLVAADGGIFSFGDVQFFGSLGSVPPPSPVKAMLPTRSNGGYYMLSSSGGVYAFGDAGFFGTPGGQTITALSY